MALPSWPPVSHDSGLFHGTLETVWPLASTLPRGGRGVGAGTADLDKSEGEQQKQQTQAGHTDLVKHIITDLDIRF